MKSKIVAAGALLLALVGGGPASAEESIAFTYANGHDVAGGEYLTVFAGSNAVVNGELLVRARASRLTIGIEDATVAAGVTLPVAVEGSTGVVWRGCVPSGSTHVVTGVVPGSLLAIRLGSELAAPAPCDSHALAGRGHVLGASLW